LRKAMNGMEREQDSKFKKSIIELMSQIPSEKQVFMPDTPERESMASARTHKTGFSRKNCKS